MAFFCCPNCSHIQEAPDEYIGRTAKCTKCEMRGEVTKTKPKTPPSAPPVAPAPSLMAPSTAQPEQSEQRSHSIMAFTDSRIPMMIIMGILAVMLVAQLSGLTSTRPHSTRWEYLIASPSDESLEERLESLGADGWEIVSARRATSSYSASYEMIFKRPK